MPYKCGDVVLVLFPNSSLRTAKRRPALVVLSDKMQTGLPQTIVAIITSNMNRGGPPSRVPILKGTPEFIAMGLLSDSIIMTDNLATVLHTEIDRTIGVCSHVTLFQNALRHTFDL